MEVRRATAQDLPAIRAVFAYARQKMRENGNPDQWGGTYPEEEILQGDLAGGHLHVITEGERICGVFALFDAPDPDYAVIDGAWPNEAPYVTIHRIAGAPDSHGILASAVAFAETLLANIRIDTHRDNHIMQAALAKQGFARCGIIQTRYGGERIAYQRTETGTTADR